MGIDLFSLNDSFFNLTVDGNNTADYSQGSRGIIANLATAQVLTPSYYATEQPRILPLGDSITAGEQYIDPTPGAYRLQLWNNFVADDLSVDFIGSQTNEDTDLDDAQHEGHPGWTIGELTALLDEGLLTNDRPDIVLVMAGTNDILRHRRASRVIRELNQLIDRLQDELPDAQILVSSLAPIDPARKGEQRANTVEEVNALLPELAAKQGPQVTYVDAGGLLDLRDLVKDGIHPNEEGYQEIGNAWYDALVERDRLTGVDRMDHIIGTVYSDRLTGNEGANILFGNGGADILTGGQGADSFVYQHLDSETDTIADFGADDHFIISASGFYADLVPGIDLTEIDPATVDFVSGSTDPLPLGTSAHILYEVSTGRLGFDPDGTGSEAAVDIALLSNKPFLNIGHFTFVS